MKIASEVLGEPYKYKSVDHAAYAANNNLIANMFEYMRLNPKYSQALDPVQMKELTEGDFVSVRAFFASHKEQMLALGPKKQ